MSFWGFTWNRFMLISCFLSSLFPRIVVQLLGLLDWPSIIIAFLFYVLCLFSLLSGEISSTPLNLPIDFSLLLFVTCRSFFNLFCFPLCFFLPSFPASSSSASWVHHHLWLSEGAHDEFLAASSFYTALLSPSCMCCLFWPRILGASLRSSTPLVGCD